VLGKLIMQIITIFATEFCPIFIIYFGQLLNKKPMESIEKKVEKKIQKQRRGKIIFASDFVAYGSSDAVFKALQRLTKKEMLLRVAHGIYYYPKFNTFEYSTEKYEYPSVEEIAEQIAKRDKIRIVPTGSYALNTLGLSTQVVMNVVFITDGAARRINVGKRRGILFKHTSEVRRLAFKSKILMLIDSALREIGENKVRPHELEIIKEKLSLISRKELDTDIELMPIWIRNIVLKLWNS